MRGRGVGGREKERENNEGLAGGGGGVRVQYILQSDQLE